MMEPAFKHVTIIGVGLLGGSVAMAIKRAMPGAAVAGVGRRRQSLDEALALGAIDTAHLDAAEPCAKSDLIILATPVGAFEAYLKQIAPVLRGDAIVTDVGSTKALVVAAAERILGACRAFVGSHPMAGSDQRGASAARADLLAGANCIVTPTPQGDPARVRRVEQFWRTLGMNVLTMSPQEHDAAVARVSHLPHALSALLMLLPSDKHLPAAATGFASMTRLAGGDVEMWRDIFATNPQEVVAAIDEYASLLARLREMIAAGLTGEIESLLTDARARRQRHTEPNNKR